MSRPLRSAPTSSSFAVGHNLRLVLAWLTTLLRLILIAFQRAFAVSSSSGIACSATIFRTFGQATAPEAQCMDLEMYGVSPYIVTQGS